LNGENNILKKKITQGKGFYTFYNLARIPNRQKNLTKTTDPGIGDYSVKPKEVAC